MTLPYSGDMSATLINGELGLSTAAQLGLGDTLPRALAGISTGDISAYDFYGKSGAPPQPPVYIGMSTSGVATELLVTSFTVYTVLTLPYQFTLNAAENYYMYWASPATLDKVKFYDRDSMFTGGWDGAYNDYVRTGPVELIVNSLLYKVYRTDFPGLGLCNWEARYDLN